MEYDSDGTDVCGLRIMVSIGLISEGEFDVQIYIDQYFQSLHAVD